MSKQQTSPKALAWWDEQVLKQDVPMARTYGLSIRNVGCESVQELELIADENEWAEIRQMARDELQRRK